MNRREIVAALGSAAAIPWLSSVASAQQPPPTVGFINAGSPAQFASLVDSFRQGLADAGYVEGRNVLIEYRWAEGHYDRLAGIAADLVNRRVAVIASTGGPAVMEASAAATTTIPVVFLGGDVALKVGVINSLNRPGGNVTGIVMSISELLSKCLQFLSELVPKESEIAILLNPNAPETAQDRQQIEAAARQIGRRIFIVTAGNPAEIDAVFAKLAERRAGGMAVQGDLVYTNRRNEMVALAAQYAIPTIYMWSEFVTVGGLIAYGNSLAEGYRQVGGYTARVLQGAKPAELPVMQPTRFRFSINLKTAKALGITIPPSLLILADDVVE